MALKDNQLYSENTRGALPAIEPANGPGAVVTRTFTAGTDTLPVGMPVCVILTTGLLEVVSPETAGQTQVVYGFVYQTDIVRTAGVEVLGTVMIKGSIDYSVIAAHLLQLAPATEVQLKDMLRKPGVEDRGLFIDGLTKAGGNAGLA
jgi:hypothetical protein